MRTPSSKPLTEFQRDRVAVTRLNITEPARAVLSHDAYAAADALQPIRMQQAVSCMTQRNVLFRNSSAFLFPQQTYQLRHTWLGEFSAALLTVQGLSTRLEHRSITDGDNNNDPAWMINLEQQRLIVSSVMHQANAMGRANTPAHRVCGAAAGVCCMVALALRCALVDGGLQRYRPAQRPHGIAGDPQPGRACCVRVE
nr:hypothetical protein [Xanthomonas arboricola]